MASLGEVRDAVFPAAARLSPGDATPAPVGWVRVMRARVPAFDALDRGDLVIVPLAALALVAPDELALTALVDALVAAGVAGVVVVGDAPPDAGIARALAASGIPAYLVTRGEPATLERSAIGFLVNRRAELERLAGDLERRVETLALADRGLDALVGEVAATLGRTVALEDRRGRPVAVHAPAGADPTAAARYAGATTPAVLRVPLPRSGDEPRGGVLALLGDAPATELERLVADRVAALLALALARDDAVRSARDARRSDALPAAGPPWVVLLARQAAASGSAAAPGSGAAGDGGDGDRGRRERDALRRDVRLLAPARRLALRGDAESLELRVVLAGDEGDPEADALTHRIAELVHRPVARSRPFSEAAGRALAEAEARTTLEAWEQLRELRQPSAAFGAGRDGPDGGPVVVRADRLAAYRLLVGLHNVPDARRQAEALLAPLRGGSPRVVRDRLATIRAVLESSGGAEAAAALGIHRNTLAYRINRLEALTGWRLADPELRLPLLAAIELVQHDQEPDREPVRNRRPARA